MKMDILLYALNIAWKVTILCIGWTLFKYVVKNGSGTFKDLLDTIGIGLKTFGHWFRMKCLNYLKREQEAKDDVREMTKEEFERKMSDHETFVL